jgi:hypothetical protein
MISVSAVSCVVHRQFAAKLPRTELRIEDHNFRMRRDAGATRRRRR